MPALRAIRSWCTAALLVMFGAAAADAAAHELSLELVALTSPVRAGQDATITVQTSPDVECLLLLSYRSGSRDVDLSLPKRGDHKGIVSWAWRVTPGAATGSWPLIVHCTDSLKGVSNSGGSRPSSLATTTRNDRSLPGTMRRRRSTADASSRNRFVLSIPGMNCQY